MSRRVEDFVIGCILGGVLGVVCGLLLAPRSGYETRRRLAVRALHAAETARAVADRAEQTAESLTERFDHYMGRDEEVAWRKVREIREGVDRYTHTQEL
jgi:gas vesicle protein